MAASARPACNWAKPRCASSVSRSRPVPCRPARVEPRDGRTQGIGGLVVAALILVHLRKREGPARSVGVEGDQALRGGFGRGVIAPLPLGDREEVQRTRLGRSRAIGLHEQVPRLGRLRVVARLQQCRRPLRLDLDAAGIEAGEPLVRRGRLVPVLLRLVQPRERLEQPWIARGASFERVGRTLGVAERGLDVREQHVRLAGVGLIFDHAPEQIGGLLVLIALDVKAREREVEPGIAVGAVGAMGLLEMLDGLAERFQRQSAGVLPASSGSASDA